MRGLPLVPLVPATAQQPLDVTNSMNSKGNDSVKMAKVADSGGGEKMVRLLLYGHQMAGRGAAWKAATHLASSVPCVIGWSV